MNWLSRIRGETTTVGLDIGNYSLKLAKIRHTKNANYLEAAGVKELPKGTIEGSEIHNKEALIDALTTLINQCDPSIVEVAISMSGHGIISDKVNFKIDPNENAEELILWEAGQRSPFDVNDITLDYRILHRNPANNEVEVLLVAAKNQIMQSYIDLLYETGLKPIIVDVDAFAIHNSYTLECQGRPDNGTVVLVNIGYDLTNVSFIKDGVYHSTRDISTAGDFFGKTLQRNLSISAEQAFDILKGKIDPSINPKLIEQTIEYGAEELSSGIDLAFSYFKSSEKSDGIDHMILSGGCASVKGLSEFLAKRHECSVRISDPLAHLEYDPELFGTVNPQKISPLLTVAIGLALRKVAA